MEAAKLTATYAESQIHLLISDLKNSNHNTRLKAVKRFQDYVQLRPEVWLYTVVVCLHEYCCGSAVYLLTNPSTESRMFCYRFMMIVLTSYTQESTLIPTLINQAKDYYTFVD